jgi:hypothetical protein
VVCADSYFLSVQAVEQLLSMGHTFTGVVETATRKLPMTSLGSIEMEMRGDRHTRQQDGGWKGQDDGNGMAR